MTFLFSLTPLLLLVVAEQVYLNNILRYAFGIWLGHFRYKLLQVEIKRESTKTFCGAFNFPVLNIYRQSGTPICTVIVICSCLLVCVGIAVEYVSFLLCRYAIYNHLVVVVVKLCCVERSVAYTLYKCALIVAVTCDCDAHLESLYILGYLDNALAEATYIFDVMTSNAIRPTTITGVAISARIV